MSWRGFRGYHLPAATIGLKVNDVVKIQTNGIIHGTDMNGTQFVWCMRRARQ
jgi:hypothetical protein